MRCNGEDDEIVFYPASGESITTRSCRVIKQFLGHSAFLRCWVASLVGARGEY